MSDRTIRIFHNNLNRLSKKPRTSRWSSSNDTTNNNNASSSSSTNLSSFSSSNPRYQSQSFSTSSIVSASYPNNGWGTTSADTEDIKIPIVKRERSMTEEINHRINQHCNDTTNQNKQDAITSSNEGRDEGHKDNQIMDTMKNDLQNIKNDMTTFKQEVNHKFNDVNDKLSQILSHLQHQQTQNMHFNNSNSDSQNKIKLELTRLSSDIKNLNSSNNDDVLSPPSPPPPPFNNNMNNTNTLTNAMLTAVTNTNKFTSSFSQQAQGKMLSLNNIERLEENESFLPIKTMKDKRIHSILVFTMNNEPFVAIGSEINTVNIIRLSDKSAIKIRPHTAAVTGLQMTQLSNGIELIASTGMDKTICLLDILLSDKKVHTFHCNYKVRTLKAYRSSTKNLLGVGCIYGRMELFCMNSKQKIGGFNSETDEESLGISGLEIFEFRGIVYIVTCSKKELNLLYLDENDRTYSSAPSIKLRQSLSNDRLYKSLTSFSRINDTFEEEEIIIAAGSAEKVELWTMTGHNHSVQKYMDIDLGRAGYITAMKHFSFSSNDGGHIVLVTASGFGWIHLFDVNEQKVITKVRVSGSKFFTSLDFYRDQDGNGVFTVGTDKGEVVIFKATES